MKGGARPRAYGERKERDGQRILQRAGYEVVRSAGSHGPIDLVAMPTPVLECCVSLPLRLVQLKAGESALSAREVSDLKRLCGAGRQVEVWLWPKWQRLPYITVITESLIYPFDSDGQNFFEFLPIKGCVMAAS
jgi:hypothetical protein